MKRLQRGLVAGLALAAVFALSPSAGAEECSLDLKYLESSGQSGISSVRDYLLRRTSSQSFFMQLMEGRAAQFGSRTPGQSKDFSEIVKKEPEYLSKHPFRGVMTLGTQQFGFALDAKPSEPEKDAAKEKDAEAPAAKSDEKDEDKPDEPPDPAVEEGYARLFIDANRNGDLTDDKVIEAEQVRKNSASLSSTKYRFVSSDFPRVDVATEADGTKMDYAFSFRVQLQITDRLTYASASLNAAAYREGEITLGGKKRQIALVDYNSNGRFDDKMTVRDARSTDGKIYPSYGDVLLLDYADAASGDYVSSYDPAIRKCQHQVSELVGIDGRFYELEISPAGDKLSLVPSSAPTGKVTNPNDGFLAMVYGDRGVLSIAGGKSEPAVLPEGEWKLLAYTIDRTGYEPKEEEDEEEETSVLGALSKVLAGSDRSPARRPRYTLVAAQGTDKCPSIEVRAGKTAEFPFGPPYKPIVRTSRRGDAVSLSMSLVGSAGEICSSLMVDGGRPDKPAFTITTPDGKEVDTGSFEYG